MKVWIKFIDGQSFFTETSAVEVQHGYLRLNADGEGLGKDLYEPINNVKEIIIKP